MVPIDNWEDNFLSNKREVFIIGAKGIPAKYGGFESFVDQLTARKQNEDIHYNIACRRDLSDNKSDFFEYNNAICFNVDVPKVGPASAIFYDVNAFKKSLMEIKKRKIDKPIVYVLACRMGPFINHFKRRLKKYNGTLFVNPDGHEWLRAKWSYPVRRYWKYSEKLMIKNADTIICDSKNIEKYIQQDYARYSPKTEYISYGSDLNKSKFHFNDEVVKQWYTKNDIKFDEYYLIVGRFVPENNYETMIREFMNSDTKKDLVIVTNVERNKFYDYLVKKTQFNNDKRIKFVGTVYDKELLKFIRERAFAYIHGHEVGGTNPSLLEALGSTKLNLLFDVGFNREVGDDSALYWNKKQDNLKELIHRCDLLDNDFIKDMDIKSNQRIEDIFDWKIIESNYENMWMNN